VPIQQTPAWYTKYQSKHHSFVNPLNQSLLLGVFTGGPTQPLFVMTLPKSEYNPPNSPKQK